MNKWILCNLLHNFSVGRHGIFYLYFIKNFTSKRKKTGVSIVAQWVKDPALPQAVVGVVDAAPI